MQYLQYVKHLIGNNTFLFWHTNENKQSTAVIYGSTAECQREIPGQRTKA